MAYTEAQRTALKEAIALGATKVRYRDREVTYRNLEEMKEILRDMDRELATLAGEERPSRVRQVRFITSKGLC
jgi:NifB/MoaA-like Fe-S oxidoreductase